jgi:hypothetical protein
LSDYRLDDLGWFQFEQLCQALLKAEHGLALEAWGGSADWGRDAYAAGPLDFPTRGAPHDGPFVFQAKFVQGANAAGARPAALVKRALAAELRRIEHRRKKNEWADPAVYALLTNAPLGTALRKSLRTAVKSALPETSFVLQGGRDISALLDDRPNIRLAYPQILGLADLNQLLRDAIDREIVKRSDFAIDEARDLAAVFVGTSSYSGALAKLNRHRFVVLTGPPEMGKTAIARMISLAKLSDKFELRECRRPDDLLKTWSDERRQVFVADDAFGSTEYRADIADAWAADLPLVLRKLDARHWLIWTSRPAPLRAGLERVHLQGAAEKFPDPGEVEVDASLLSEREKALILYRHAKAAGLSDSAREIVKSYAVRIVSNEHFTPLRIRQFVAETLKTIGEGAAPEELDLDRALEAALERPTVAMAKSFRALSSAQRTLLIAMLDAGSDAPVEGEDLEAAFGRLRGDDDPPTRELLAVLDHHFVRQTDPEFLAPSDRPGIDWVHPTWRDLVIDHLQSQAGARRRFLRRCGTDGLLLALSTRGGAEGERAFPFLQGHDDWEAVAKRIAELTADGTEQDLEQILAALPAARTVAQEAGETAAVAELDNLTGSVLSAWRNRYAQDVAPLAGLRLYYEASIALTPLPPSPELAATWVSCRQEAAKAAEVEDLMGYRDMSAVDLWLRLARLLRDNEPRFLRAVRFPEDDVDLMRRFLERIREELGVVPLDDDRDFVSEDRSKVDLAEGTLQLIRLLAPSLAADAADTAAAAEDAMQEREEMFPDEDEDEDQERYRDYEPDAEDLAALRDPDEDMPDALQVEYRVESVEAIFEDL